MSSHVSQLVRTKRYRVAITVEGCTKRFFPGRVKLAVYGTVPTHFDERNRLGLYITKLSS